MKKVEELSEDLLKLEDKNRSVVAELEMAKKTEESNAKTYEDELKVVHWTCDLDFIGLVFVTLVKLFQINIQYHITCFYILHF